MTQYKTPLIIFGILIAGAVGLAIAGQESPRAGGGPSESRIHEAIPAAAELKNLALKYDVRITSLEKQLDESRQGVHSLQQALATLTTMIEDLRKPLPQDPTPPPTPPLAPGRLLSIEVASSAGPGPALTIPAGSFGEATLLTGVYAPVTGDPLPVLVRLDAVLMGPNKSRVPVQQSLMLGKAVGDANTSRAVIQLSTFSLVKPDGGTIEKPVNGYIVDADGIQGLQGEYIWNAKQLVGLSMLAGASTGVAGAFGQAQTTVLTGPGGATREVTRDLGLYVGSAGASKAFENVGKIIEDRLKEFVPAIYVSNRERRVTVVFLQGVTLTGVQAPKPADSNLGGFDK